MSDDMNEYRLRRPAEPGRPEDRTPEETAVLRARLEWLNERANIPADMSPEDHRARWAELSPLAKAYAAMWDSLRADTDGALIELFRAEPVLVEEAAAELFEVFPEWEDMPPEHGAIYPPPA